MESIATKSISNCSSKLIIKDIIFFVNMDVTGVGDH